MEFEENWREKELTGQYQENRDRLEHLLCPEKNFDLISREIEFGGKKACMYLIDGFCKDELLQKLIQYFMDMTEEDMPDKMELISRRFTPYVEVETTRQFSVILDSLLSGMFILLVDGYEEALLIDSRTYPARNVEEPDKDKSLRGSKDGFVETIVFNTALIRRRIRSVNLRMEIMKAGMSSKTDIVLCYMQGRVDEAFLEEIKRKIEAITVDSLTMNQESLAECLFRRNWLNPFPKFRYTERPDVAAAQILEGSIVVLVDNSPSAMILPTTLFDVVEEVDDYYFPPVTGSYLRFARFVITLFTYFVTPTFLLLMNHPQWIPENFSFIMLAESPNIPLIWQFLILELAIDGLKLAAVNTPNMLSTPLSVMAALVLGEFSVNSGWFSAEVMLYMAFVAISNYTQVNYELGYALKFLRIITLITTQIFGIYGYVGGVLLTIILIGTNKTISGKSYLYPLIPFDGKKIKKRLMRNRINV